MLGYVDLMLETDDALVVIDLKTARCRWTASQAENSGDQLLLYGELARPLVPDKEVRLEFAVATKTKEPSIETLPVTYDPHRVRRLRNVAEHVWRAITAGHFFPTPSPISCGSCPFKRECGKWSG